MGNHPSHGPVGGAAAQGSVSDGPSGEPLEAFSKEKQRDDHLKNLGFKRSKSLRKSLAKRLKRKKKQNRDVPDGQEDTTSKSSVTGSLETRVERVDRTGTTETKDKPLVGLPQPLPASVQVIIKT